MTAIGWLAVALSRGLSALGRGLWPDGVCCCQGANRAGDGFEQPGPQGLAVKGVDLSVCPLPCDGFAASVGVDALREADRAVHVLSLGLWSRSLRSLRPVRWEASQSAVAFLL